MTPEAKTTETRTCDRHGCYEAEHLFGDRWMSCPACRDERARAQREENERREREYQAAQERERHENRMAASGLEGRFLRANFASYEAKTVAQRETLATVQAYALHFTRATRGTLWLIGTPGTGKSHLASALVHEVIERHKLTARITTPREIVRTLRATWRKGSEATEEAVIDEFASISLLVLDEVGVSFGSDAELVQLFDVLDARYRRERPTMLISNLAPVDIKSALGDRLFDRLREGARVLVCDWESYRGRTAA